MRNSDYSLLVACFAGGITAICILVIGITLTLYRRNHPIQPMKTQTHIVHCEDKTDNINQSHSTAAKNMDVIDNKDVNKSVASLTKDTSDDRSMVEGLEENPDVIPNKLERRADARYNGSYAAKPERTKEFADHLEALEHLSPASVLHGKDTWIYPNGYVDRSDVMNPARPSTLPVHRTHDIYTRSLRVQESCI